jgi:Predicted permease
MAVISPVERELERRADSRMLDVLIRAGLVFTLAVLCFEIFAPFLTLMVWALILAVALYPLHQALSRRIGDRQGLASTLIVVLGFIVLVAPTLALVSSFGDSVQGFVAGVQNNTLRIPAPRASIEHWPIVGERIYGVWMQAYNDLPALVATMQPKIGHLARTALGVVASIGGGMLMFIASFIIAGIIMAFGRAGEQSSVRIFARIMSPERAEGFARLSTATIRAVAQGVIGVAAIQAIVIGITLLVAGVPFAGVLALVVLILGIAQIPALLVTVPVIIYLWSSGDYATVPAIIYTVVLAIGGVADNFLKPLMLGRGVDAPMPVILLGALGGMATAGILGLFVGSALLALGYQIFMTWVARVDPPVTTPVSEPTTLA